MVILGTAFTLMVVWGVTIAVQTRDLEGGRPYLSWSQVACMGACAAAGLLNALIWVLAAFRPEEASAETTRMLSDFGWFIFVSYWQPFSLWVAAIGLAILQADRVVSPLARIPLDLGRRLLRARGSHLLLQDRAVRL